VARRGGDEAWNSEFLGLQIDPVADLPRGLSSDGADAGHGDTTRTQPPDRFPGIEQGREVADRRRRCEGHGIHPSSLE
jgi:hypothetical protein